MKIERIVNAAIDDVARTLEITAPQPQAVAFSDTWQADTQGVRRVQGSDGDLLLELEMVHFRATGEDTWEVMQGDFEQSPPGCIRFSLFRLAPARTELKVFIDCSSPGFNKLVEDWMNEFAERYPEIRKSGGQIEAPAGSPATRFMTLLLLRSTAKR